jgi:hypothetical protein
MNDYLIELILFFIFCWLSSIFTILGPIILGFIYTGIFIDTFHKLPLDVLHISLSHDLEFLNFFVFPFIFYIIGNNLNKKENNQENYFNNIDCPLEIVAFRSRNNLFTAGNNDIAFKVRNNSDMPYLFNIELLVGNEWKDSGYGEFEIGPKEIKRFDILGPAWRKAKDIRISYCR